MNCDRTEDCDTTKCCDVRRCCSGSEMMWTVGCCESDSTGCSDSCSGSSDGMGVG